jgi:hypothetical protein
MIYAYFIAGGIKPPRYEAGYHDNNRHVIPAPLRGGFTPLATDRAKRNLVLHPSQRIARSEIWFYPPRNGASEAKFGFYAPRNGSREGMFF